MKTKFLLFTASCVLLAGAAQAQLVIQPTIVEPQPTYGYAPAPVVVDRGPWPSEYHYRHQRSDLRIREHEEYFAHRDPHWHR